MVAKRENMQPFCRQGQGVGELSWRLRMTGGAGRFHSREVCEFVIYIGRPKTKVQYVSLWK